MSKNKLQRFAEMETFSNVIQVPYDKIFNKNFELKGNWAKTFFKNSNPTVVEFGCGKGEYTVNLAQKSKNKNFLGVDIKGARIWKGAKYALENNISNVGFLRTRIEFANSFFSTNEISEIWLTFPDPQEKDRRALKRLTSSRFLNLYKQIIIPNGLIHLKTDNTILYYYTLEIIKKNNLSIQTHSSDLYNDFPNDETLAIKTFYETRFLNEGKKIYYICFTLNTSKVIEEPDEKINLI